MGPSLGPLGPIGGAKKGSLRALSSPTVMTSTSESLSSSGSEVLALLFDEPVEEFRSSFWCWKIEKEINQLHKIVNGISSPNW